jgi:hypothetical protein
VSNEPARAYDVDTVYAHGYHGIRYRRGQLPPDALAAYQLGGADKAAGRDPRPKGQRAKAEPEPEPAPAPGATPPPTGGAAGGSSRRRPAAGGRKRGLARPLPARIRRAVPVPGGTTGGLLLAVVLYPIGLSLVRYGTAGPGMWLRAKFLNQASDTAAPPAAPPRGGGPGGGAPHYRST